jgi:hypothetical protein
VGVIILMKNERKKRGEGMKKIMMIIGKTDQKKKKKRERERE